MKLCGQMRNIFYVILIILSTATNYNCRNSRGRTNQDTTVIENQYLRIISYNGNKGYCNDILENIMSKYFTILNDLGVNNMPKITIRIYPTLDSFHQATNMVGSSNWVVATSWGKDEFRMTAPTAQGLPVSYEEMTRKLPVHEFTHCATLNLVDPRKLPYWLWEGIALYEAVQKSDLKKIAYFNEEKWPTYEELSSFQKAFELGYSLVEYIDNHWGMEKVRDLILASGNIESVFNKTKEEFLNDWKEFIKQRYLGQMN